MLVRSIRLLHFDRKRSKGGEWPRYEAGTRQFEYVTRLGVSILDRNLAWIVGIWLFRQARGLWPLGCREFANGILRQGLLQCAGHGARRRG